MDKIDLDAIYKNTMGNLGSTTFPSKVKEMMKEAIHQALVLASDKARLGGIRNHVIEKQSILDVEKLIV